MKRARAHTTVALNDLLGFELAGIRYAIGIASVREITRPLTLIPIPQGPPEVLGLADYRDEVLAVVDLRKSLGFEARRSTDPCKWVVANAGDQFFALVVDTVTDVFSSAGQSPRPVPNNQREQGITHAYKDQADLVFVMDLTRLSKRLRMVDVGRLSAGGSSK